MMLGHYPTDILISLSIFFLSLWMLLIFRTNIILIIFSLELLLLANILGFIITSVYLDDIIGELFGLFILVIGAIETAVALSIVLSYYRLTNHNLTPLTNSNDFFSLSIFLLTIKSNDDILIVNILFLLSCSIIVLYFYFILRTLRLK